jgi:uncharacterized Zn finger protein (UPF0148 family)
MRDTCARCGKPLYGEDPSPYCDDCWEHIWGAEERRQREEENRRREREEAEKKA